MPLNRSRALLESSFRVKTRGRGVNNEGVNRGPPRSAVADETAGRSSAQLVSDYAR